MEHDALLTIAAVLAVGTVCQWLAWRVKIPAILPLLAVGFLAGPILGWLHPQAQMGGLFFPIVSLSVAVILFEGALTLTWREVRTVATTVRNLLIIGSLVTWVGSALAARYLLALPWDLALLFGALIIVTGPTVIAPLLRNVRPTAKISSILRWEGIVIDPLGATVAVLVYEFIVAGGASWGHTLVAFLRIVATGSLLGLGGGYLLYYLVQRFLVPDYLREIAVLTAVIGIFALSNSLAAESGLLAVTVMGILLANTKLRQLREIWYFKERLSVLLISTLFILLAANITLADLAILDWRAAVVLAVVILLLRPLGVQLSALGSTLSRNERLFLSWVAPRGIVAAAVSSLFTFELLEFGYAEARIIGPLVFLVIVGTVVLQGSTAKALARRLGVSEAEPQGFLLMGVTPFSSLLAETLQKAGFQVRLIDSNGQHVIKARLQGLTAEHGNLLSTFIEESLELGGIGRLLALTSNDEANAVACHHFQDEFGSKQVYQLAPSRPTGRQHSRNLEHLGRLLFSETLTYGKLESMVEEGAVMKRTPLTAQFTLEDYHRQYPPDQSVILMALQGKQVTLATVDQPLQVQPGSELLSLVLPAPTLPSSATAQSNGVPHRTGLGQPVGETQ